MASKRKVPPTVSNGRKPVKKMQRKPPAKPQQPAVGAGTLLAELRQVTGWSRVQIADKLACSEGLLRRMEADETAVPTEVLDWLKKVAEAIKSLPPPHPKVWKSARLRPEGSAHPS